MNLKVLSWNIAFGYGEGSEGTTGYQQKPRQHFEETLDAMAEFIRNVNIDIVLLQEVDFHCHRSHHLNQLDWLARKTDLHYRTEVISWDKFYVPYPGLNPKNHFGEMKSGGGILSKFPLSPIMIELLPKPKENFALYNYFYLSRYLQLVQAEIEPGRKLNLMNLHLEAFSQENRALHLVKVQNRLVDYGIHLAGGDFNGAPALSDSLKETYNLFPAPSPTFPSSAPTETLDAFILRKGITESYQIKTLDTGSLSDHFPVLMELSLK
jgi:endonuclease/exonuclease/phosphatase family metal-dependent hydrolase